jgi:hypothetical protein
MPGRFSIHRASIRQQRPSQSGCNDPTYTMTLKVKPSAFVRKYRFLLREYEYFGDGKRRMINSQFVDLP